MKRVYSVICIFLLLCISYNLSSQEIFTAITQRNIQKVNELLAQDSLLVSLKNSRGFSPIHFAANFDQIEIAKSLAAYGADLSIKDRLGRMPSHWAASTNSIEILEWLSQNNISFDIKDDSGKTPIYYAITGNADNAVDFLISNNIQLTFENNTQFKRENLRYTRI